MNLEEFFIVALFLLKRKNDGRAKARVT